MKEWEKEVQEVVKGSEGERMREDEKKERGKKWNGSWWPRVRASTADWGAGRRRFEPYRHPSTCCFAPGLCPLHHTCAYGRSVCIWRVSLN